MAARAGPAGAGPVPRLPWDLTAALGRVAAASGDAGSLPEGTVTAAEAGPLLRLLGSGWKPIWAKTNPLDLYSLPFLTYVCGLWK